MLHPAQLAVGMGRRIADAGWNQACHFGAHQQSDVASIVDQGWVAGRL